MDEAVMQRLIERHLPEEARLALSSAYDVAYREAGSRFVAGIGLDSQWLGFTLFKLGTFALAAMAKTGQFGFRDASEGGHFRLGFGPFMLSPYGCGASAPVDPWKHFPSNDSGAGMLSDINTGQLWFQFGPMDGMTVGLILAHYGNPANGLEALYLKIPAEQREGRITRWSYVQQLWRYDEGQVGNQPDLPRPVVPQRPKLTLKRPITPPKTGSSDNPKQQ